MWPGHPSVQLCGLFFRIVFAANSFLADAQFSISYLTLFAFGKEGRVVGKNNGPFYPSTRPRSLVRQRTKSNFSRTVYFICYVQSCVKIFLPSSDNHPQNVPLLTPKLHYIWCNFSASHSLNLTGMFLHNSVQISHSSSNRLSIHSSSRRNIARRNHLICFVRCPESARSDLWRSVRGKSSPALPRSLTAARSYSATHPIMHKVLKMNLGNFHGWWAATVTGWEAK